MTGLSSQQATNWREGRRLRAWELSQEGWPQQRIAEALGVSKGAVSQWLSRTRAQGPQALRHCKPPGRQPKLAHQQRLQLLELLAQGPLAFGFRGDVWTQPRVAEVIRRHFGVKYHPSQVGRILKQYGWSRQKPSRRAQQRDEEAIRRWKEERWPALKKRPGTKAGPSSSWTKRVATCCPWWSRPMPLGARLQCSGHPSAGTICR